MDITPRHRCRDLHEFNALLLRWLSGRSDETLAAQTGFKKDYLIVPIGGVECSLSGDSTRQGVLNYLLAAEFGTSVYSVVPNSKGVVNRVVVGDAQEPIPGFYLYTTELQDEPCALVDDWLAGSAEDRVQVADVVTSATQPLPDLAGVSGAKLFELYAGVLAELRARDVVRTNNPPAGDYAEWLMAKAFGALLEKNSKKSYDLMTERQGRIQVKARVVSPTPTAGQLQTSPFRSKDFDVAAFVLFSQSDYEVVAASLVPLSVLEQWWKWNKHMNGYRLHMKAQLMAHPEAIDITGKLRAAAESLQ